MLHGKLAGHQLNSDSLNLLLVHGSPRKINGRRGCYVLLTVDETSTTLNRDLIQVDFIRFDYDVEKAASAMESSPLPNQFADMLQGAY